MHHFARRTAACTMTLAAATLLFAGCSNDDDNGNDSGSSGSATTSEAATTSEHAMGGESGAATETKIATQNGEIAVSGNILQKYNEAGGATSPLGEPTAAAVGGPEGGSCQEFTGGAICASEKTGAHIVWGDIRTEWESNGGVNGSLGYPTTDEEDADAGKKSDFTGGSISWNSTDRQTTVTPK
ncbi:LGFP repeat-containing protein [Nocardia sp. BMG51109]|uniref:LGFP repeat-containing protein n=1 Tax=Nocardia sp. BMG51109 TaxID=1056816 RepID=UPI0004632126|nr:esterase [Nocardia sp. BMG51109]